MFEQCKYLEIHPKDETFGWQFLFCPGNDVYKILAVLNSSIFLSHCSLSKENKLTINTGIFQLNTHIFGKKKLIKSQHVHKNIKNAKSFQMLLNIQNMENLPIC